MARPTYEKLLQKALAEGDVEKAKELVVKIAQKNTKVKTKTKKTQTKSKSPDYITTTRKSGRTVQGSDPDKNYGKVVGMNNQFHNNFVDDGSLAVKEKEFDKKHPLKRTSRDRPKFRKITVVCNSCGKKEKIAPALTKKKIGSEYAFYKCDSCCKGK